MTDIITEAAAHIAKSADSIPPGRTRDAMLRGEGADDRLSLLVRLTKALGQQSDATTAEQWADSEKILSTEQAYDLGKARGLKEGEAALEQQRRETQAMKDYGDRAVVKLNAARFALRDVLSVFTAQTPEELEGLPIGSVIRDGQTLVLERYTSGWRNGWRDPVQDVAHLAYPVRILFVPEKEQS